MEAKVRFNFIFYKNYVKQVQYEPNMMEPQMKNSH